MAAVVEHTDLALDIGSKTHAYCCETRGVVEEGTVANTPDTLRTFLKGMRERTGVLRVLVEATGIYYLDVALIAHELGAEVFVINPKTAHHFAKARSQRSKTDRLDAAMLLQFLQRMGAKCWVPPRKALLELRCFGRYLVQLTEDCTASKNRLHALCATQANPAALRADLKRAITSMQKRIDRIRTQAITLIKADPELAEPFKALVSVIGIADTSAVSLLSELMVLPFSLRARACVCHAGLDPRIFESGTSVHKATRISKQGNKYLRRALYHPAMAASNHDPHAKAFKARLIARGKKPMQAIVAIMRKLLTAIWAIIRNPKPYDAKLLYAEAKIA
jgi:transposase